MQSQREVRLGFYDLNELTDNINDVLGFSDAFIAWYTRKPVSVGSRTAPGKS